MKKEMIVQLHRQFEQGMRTEQETGVEFWLARDLQEILGYQTWRSFVQVVEKAITACQNSGYDPNDHFAETSKMVPLGSGAEREVGDYMLTRYACYLIAQNGDPTKEPIAFAQTYFAVQTQKMEVIEQRLAELERLNARKQLTESERRLSGIIFVANTSCVPVAIPPRCDSPVHMDTAYLETLEEMRKTVQGYSLFSDPNLMNYKLTERYAPSIPQWFPKMR
jgi:hypothetical protein